MHRWFRSADDGRLRLLADFLRTARGLLSLANHSLPRNISTPTTVSPGSPQRSQLPGQHRAHRGAAPSPPRRSMPAALVGGRALRGPSGWACGPPFPRPAAAGVGWLWGRERSGARTPTGPAALARSNSASLRLQDLLA